MSNGNKEIIEVFFKEMLTVGVMEALARHAVPEHVWWCQGLGNIQGRNGEYQDALSRQLAGEAKLTIHGMTVEGDRVAVEAESYMPLRNGTIYNNRYHFLFELADGKIKEVREYNDTKHSQEVFLPLLAAAEE